jgi:hypothetical protein
MPLPLVALAAVCVSTSLVSILSAFAAILMPLIVGGGAGGVAHGNLRASCFVSTPRETLSFPSPSPAGAAGRDAESVQESDELYRGGCFVSTS